MLLTGFDAPLEQVLYLDRAIRDHDLLQAIARVNRTCPNKHCGLVVDYYGVGHHLKEALAVYADEDVAGALTSIKDELPIHWHTVLLPPPIADYIVVHEVAHLIEKHHTPRFWSLVERVLPNFQARKQWLAENGGGYGF